jgi:ferrous iron transport protein B
MLKILALGNPNVGKSSLINALAGSDLRVGNWAGSTVARLEVQTSWDGRPIHLIDLPGCYSNLGATAEEKICRQELLSESPDLLLNVIDSTNFRRNLSLTLELLELGIPTIVVLNLWDEHQKAGGGILPEALGTLLGASVCTTAARTGVGVEQLRHLIASCKTGPQAPYRIAYPAAIEGALTELEQKGLARWQSLLLLGLDEESLKGTLEGRALLNNQTSPVRDSICSSDDPYFAICQARLDALQTVCEDVCAQLPEVAATGSRIDRIVLNQWLGLPLFLLSMLLLFRVTFLFSQPWVTFLSEVKSVAIGWVSGMGLPPLLANFISHGVLDGMGTVAAFVPVLFILYSYLGFLESSGYLSRITFVFDRVMATFGLPGRALIPLLLGFGCNVASVYATRTLEDPRDRLRVALASPFMACSARLAVFVLFGAVFFPSSGSGIVFGLYVLGLVLGLATACVLGLFLPTTEKQLAVMELPSYRLPSVSLILKMAYRQVVHFLKDAFQPIMGAVLVVWIMLSFPQGSTPESSYYGRVGSGIATVMGPVGITDWRLAGALVPGFIAKEVVIGTLGVSYLGAEKDVSIGFGEGLSKIGGALKAAGTETINAFPELVGLPKLMVETEASSDLQRALRSSASSAAALAYMVVVLLYTPCVATIAAINQEFGRRWGLFSLVYQLVVAYVLGAATFWVASLIL